MAGGRPQKLNLSLHGKQALYGWFLNRALLHCSNVKTAHCRPIGNGTPPH
jgi:hypothetical protein